MILHHQGLKFHYVKTMQQVLTLRLTSSVTISFLRVLRVFPFVFLVNPLTVQLGSQRTQRENTREHEEYEEHEGYSDKQISVKQPIRTGS